MSFGNPLGLFALAGLVAVVLIHFLRIRARKIRASTLFLLETSPVSSRGGRRLERLRSSPLFWVQLLAVLVLTWVLVEPRWLREDSTLRVAIVLDESASMSAFEDSREALLRASFSTIEGAAATVEWIVLASDAREKRIYSGTSREEAIQAILASRPRLPSHDPSGVLATARGVAGSSGLVVFVTDHVVPVPEGVELLATGSPRDNVGFAGVEVSESGSFRALVKSSSSRAETRSFLVEREGTAAEVLELGPGEVRFVSGSFAEGEEKLTLVLEGDVFPLDDRLPLVRPRPKSLRIFVSPELERWTFLSRFLETLSPVERVPDRASADLALASAPVSDLPAIVLPPAAGERGFLTGAIVGENDPLVEGLVFEGLVAPKAGPFAPAPSDRVVLWQGERAIVTVRDEPQPNLLLGLSLEGSNAERVPAFVLLLHRFAESVRSSLVGREQRNVELHQLVEVAALPSAPLEVLGVERGAVFRAPDEPGFFAARQGSRTLLEAAAHFADVRESDLREAGSRELDPAWRRSALERNTLPDPLRPLWLLALLGLALGAFRLQEKEG